MKINNYGKVNLNPYQKNIMKQEQIPQSKKKDQLEISNEAMELQKGNPIELERQNLVKELKEKVQSGEYEIEPKKIAEKMYSYWNEEF
jgi:negative regulator of flagellin synthesis FlgM